MESSTSRVRMAYGIHLACLSSCAFLRVDTESSSRCSPYLGVVVSLDAGVNEVHSLCC